MSLQVWLPLNGNLQNKGLGNINITNNNAIINNNGKIGKCYNVNNNNGIIANNITLGRIFSISFWIKINTYNSNWANAFKIYKDTCDYIGLCMNTITSNPLQLGFHIYRNNGSNVRQAVSDVYYLPLEISKWYHLTFIVNQNTIKTYQNGQLIKTQSFILDFPFVQNYILSLGRSSSFSGLDCNLNDFRLYDHALSLKEIKEISKGLVLHYPLDNNGLGNINPNLFCLTSMKDRTNFVDNHNTDFTKPFRYYNGNASIHTFSVSEMGGYEDTILLNNSGNLGIAFVRQASDINLDSSSYYTISCEAKCSKENAHLDIGLSYYKTNNTWIWRGGTNPQNFNEINTWQKFTLTFKPDSDTQVICYCFTVKGTTNGTDTWSIRHCKLEKDTQATSWIPNQNDQQYTTLGYNDTTIYDCSGYQNNGIKTDNITYIKDSPRYETSVVFTGEANKYIRANYLPFLTNNLTMCCWVRQIQSTTTNQFIMGQGRDCQIYGFNLRARGNVVYVSAGQEDSNIDCGSSAINITDGKWHHIVGTYDGTTLRLYIDGIQRNHSTAITGISYAQASESFVIGKMACLYTNPNSYFPFNGYISDARVYATALNKEDITQLYYTSALADRNSNFYTYFYQEQNNIITHFSKKGICYNNNLIEDILKTASGSIAHFEDGAEANAVSVIAHIEPVQDLHGYDSPWPAGGGKNLLKPRSGSTITREGVTFSFNSDETITITGTPTARYAYGGVYGVNTVNVSLLKPLLTGLSAGGNLSLTIEGNTSGIGLITQFNKSDGTVAGRRFTESELATTVFSDAEYMFVAVRVDSNAVTTTPINCTVKLQITNNNAIESWTPYSNICPISGHTEVETVVSPTTSASDGTTHTTDLGGTYYGGTLDVVSGVLTVDRAMVDLGTLNYTYDASVPRFYSTGIKTSVKPPQDNDHEVNAISSAYKVTAFNRLYTADKFDGTFAVGNTGTLNFINRTYTTAADFKSAMSGVQLVYELATPQTIQLTPQQVALLVGTNNIWHDANGETKVEYRTSQKKIYINRENEIFSNNFLEI